FELVIPPYVTTSGGQPKVAARSEPFIARRSAAPPWRHPAPHFPRRLAPGAGSIGAIRVKPAGPDTSISSWGRQKEAFMTTDSGSTLLEKFLAEVEVLDPVNVNGFQVFGLKRPGESKVSYLTLDEALQTGLVDVTEISEGGSVPTLKVSNKTETLLFLMAG